MIRRGFIVVAPATGQRWFNDMIGNESRVRILGLSILSTAALLIWAGALKLFAPNQ